VRVGRCYLLCPRHFFILQSRARICKPYKEPRNQFSAWRAGTTTLIFVSHSQATKAVGIYSSDSIPGFLKRLQIRAQASRHIFKTTWTVFPPSRIFLHGNNAWREGGSVEGSASKAILLYSRCYPCDLWTTDSLTHHVEGAV